MRKKFLFITLIFVMVFGLNTSVSLGKTDYSLKLSSKSVNLYVGQKTTVKATSSPKNQKIKWSTEDKKIATVSSKGVVTGKNYGTTYVTAKFSYKGKVYKKRCKIIVRKVKTVSGVKLSIPSDSQSVNVTWKKVSGASGYSVYRSTKKSSGFKNIKNCNSKTSSFKDSSGVVGKKYYYKVRAYRTYKGKKYYGSMSSVSSIKYTYAKPKYMVSMADEADNEVVFFSVKNDSKASDMVITGDFVDYNITSGEAHEIFAVAWCASYTGPYIDFEKSITVKPGKTVYVGLIQKNDEGYIPSSTQVSFSFTYNGKKYVNYSTLSDTWYK